MILLLLIALISGVFVVTIGLALVKLKAAPLPVADYPDITIIRPVCGLEYRIEDTLRSTFELRYAGAVQVLFCVDEADDPVASVVQRLIDSHPHVNAKLLIGRDRISGNPKLNNMAKGWREASSAFVLMVDSNVLMPVDCLDQLVSHMHHDVGLVSAPPQGFDATNLWGRLECAFLNGYQGRYQMASDALGQGFAQGKILFWRREVLERAGGLAALGHDVAEDVASTKVVRRAGYEIALLDQLAPQPIGARSLRDVWNRQLRWAKVRRMGFPALYAAEILSGPVIPLMLTVFAGVGPELPVAFALLWYGGEFILARLAGWPHGLRDVASWAMRDVMLPVLYVMGWLGSGFEWRGNAVVASEAQAR